MAVPDKVISSEAFKHRWSSPLLTSSPQKSFRKKKGKKDLLKEGICQNIKHGIIAYYIVEIEELSDKLKEKTFC